MIDQRNTLTKKQQREYSDAVSKLVLESEIYKQCDRICIYQAFRNEVSCDKIMEQAFADQKQVFVPVTDSVQKKMEFYQITKDTKWQSGAYGIMEPVLENRTQILEETACILMPGMVFDRNKHRIGYGGGYYDKYLSIHTKHITAALCYHFQIVEDQLPFEEHDILPDYIITDNELF